MSAKIRNNYKRLFPQQAIFLIGLKMILRNFLEKKTLVSIADQICKEPYIDINIKKKIFENYKWETILKGENIFKNIIRIKNQSNITKLPHFENGSWWVQGLSASLPVFLISTIFKTNKRKVTVLDVEAAPGGKSFQIIDLGFKVKSIEISKKRVLTFNSNLNRLNISSEIINEDFLNFKINKKFDCVLIDAPCSGSGLMQKKPEILVLKKDISNLVEQKKNATKSFQPS